MEGESSARLSADEKWAIISRDIPRGEGEADYVIGEDEIRAILKERDISLYWGTATTGAPHVGYFVPIYKLGDYLRAGCHVTILFADLHGFLDNMKSSWELLHHRCVWYEAVIKEMLRTVGVPLDRLKFIKGTSYQLQQNYTLDVYKVTALVTTAHAQHAGAEVVKQSEHPRLSNLLYPILQALDEEYLGVDVQFGGVDQRKIFMFAREWLPRIGYRKRAYLMNTLIPGLTESGKMSSSEPLSKVDLHDTEEAIHKKIGKAFSVDGKVQGNGLLAMLKHILFRYLEHKKRPFVSNGVEYTKYDDVERDFVSGKLLSKPLKDSVAQLLAEFLTPLREFCDKNKHLFDAAYPPVVAAPEVPDVCLEAVTIESVTQHAESKNHLVLQVKQADGTARTCVPKLASDIELKAGEIVVVAVNCVAQDVKGVKADCQLVHVALFNQQTKKRNVCAVRSPVAGTVHFGQHKAQAPAEPHSLGAVEKTLKVVVVKDGAVWFKNSEANVAGQRITAEVESQLKI